MKFSHLTIGCAVAAMMLCNPGCAADDSKVKLPTPQVKVLTPQVNVPTSQAYTWRNVIMGGGGFVDGIITHPKQAGLIYARTDVGGAYRWDSKKKQWIPLTDWVSLADNNLLGIESIAIDPTDPKRVYLAAGTYTQSWAGTGAILRSQDQGKTWQRSNLPIKLGGNEDGRLAGERLAVDPNQPNILYFGSRKEGLWKSSDYGATWARDKAFPVTDFPNGIGIAFVVFDQTTGAKGKASQTIYAGVSRNDTSLYRSTDGGATWEAVSGQPTGLRPNHGTISPDGNIYLSYGDNPGPNGMGDGAVWKYNTKSQTWTDITPLKISDGDHFGYGGVTFDAQHPNTLMAVTLDRWSHGDEIFRSTDGGTHWTPLAKQIVRDAAGAKWLYWHKDKLGGTGWMGDVEIDPKNSNHALYVTGQGIWESNDVTNADSGKPTHWRFTDEGLEEIVVHELVSPPSGAHLLSAVWDIDGFRHDNLDASSDSGMFNPSKGSNTSIDFAEQNPNIVARVFYGNDERGAYSLDGGTTWTLFSGKPDGKGGGKIGVSADGSMFVWTSEGAAPTYSRDHGTTWTPCSGLAQDVRVVADRVNAQKWYGFDTKAGAVFVSTDGGVNFTKAAMGLPNGGKLRTPFGKEGDVWLSSDGGLYHSTDSGASFTKLDTVQSAFALGFGKSALGKTYPSLYLVGKTGNVAGIFRSDDIGMTWVRINDDQHQYGWTGAITGDPRVYGRVYVGTGGRGILYADPK